MVRLETRNETNTRRRRVRRTTNRCSSSDDSVPVPLMPVVCDSLSVSDCISRLSSAIKLLAMSGITTVLGTTESIVLLGYLATKQTLPNQIKYLPPMTSVTSDRPATLTCRTTPTTISSTIGSTLIPPGSSTSTGDERRRVVLDHRLARRLLHISFRLKQIWGRTLVRLYGLDVKYTDHNHGSLTSQTGPYLFVHLNQNCLLESIVFPSAPTFLPAGFLMNYEFCLIPFLGWNLWMTGVCIDRANKVSAQMGAEETIRLMKDENRSMYMSIEGHRSEDGGLHTYKRGAAYMAIRAQATIVPIISKGFRDALPYGDWRVRPNTHLEVIFEKAIPTVGMNLSDRHLLTQRLWDLAIHELTPPNAPPPQSQPKYHLERPQLPSTPTTHNHEQSNRRPETRTQAIHHAPPTSTPNSNLQLLSAL